MIPQSFITDLLNRVDIVDVVGRYVQLKKGGANFMGLCPFHSEKSPSFTVSPTKQFYHCFGCGAHGTAIGFLIEYSGMGFVDAVKDLAQNVGMIVPEADDKIPPMQRAAQQAQSLAMTDALSQACDYYRAQLRAVIVAGLAQGVGHRQRLRLLGGALHRRNLVVGFGHDHADVLGQVLDRIDEAHARVFDQEADGGAMGAAAETVIELLGRADGEARGLFAMERTQPHEIGAALFQLDVAPNHIDDVDTVEQIGNE